MVNSIHTKHAISTIGSALCALFMLLPFLCDAATSVARRDVATDKPKLDAASLELDGPSNLLVLTEVHISTQSGYVIQAGEARTSDANNFNNSRWAFKNKVVITTPDGRSTADSATVSFVENQISTLHITGNPATFAQHDAKGQIIAQGHAGIIDYDLAQHTVRLSDDAWISYGQNECRAAALVYNINAQRVSANREEQHGQRINCTISPNSNAISNAGNKTTP